MWHPEELLTEKKKLGTAYSGGPRRKREKANGNKGGRNSWGRRLFTGGGRAEINEGAYASSASKGRHVTVAKGMEEGGKGGGNRVEKKKFSSG